MNWKETVIKNKDIKWATPKMTQRGKFVFIPDEEEE